MKSPGRDKFEDIPDTQIKAIESIERVFELEFIRCHDPNCQVDFYPKGEHCSCRD